MLIDEDKGFVKALVFSFPIKWVAKAEENLEEMKAVVTTLN